MIKSAIYEVIKNYVKTTTLHGFKYLYSAYYLDRVVWILCCGASACCAGVLCAVLWARFLEVPALLTLSDNINNGEVMADKIPAIIVCPTTENVAAMYLEKFFSENETENQRIPRILARLLTGKFISKDQLLFLDDFLVNRNLNLSEIMLNYEPSCSQHTKRCRYQETIVPCEELFQSEMTTSGTCCVIDPKKWKNLSESFEARTHTTQILDFVLQYTQGSKDYGCELITMYDNEEDNGSDFLLPGNLYMAYQKFIVIFNNPGPDNLMEITCDRRKGYSMTSCMLKCVEMFCGCRDPFSPEVNDETSILPICPVTRLQCVRGTKSSLGGVFNMFLGVGLFSALEFLFLILVKLPAALKKSSEMDPIAKHDLSVQRQQSQYPKNEIFPYRDRQRHKQFAGFEPY
ncbi:unnamed protein product [Arctia plantaginis]|uniref:Uncharacterized protein n=1 Tax=Arctia plantaginis TaxID=874455 RepID=A0A8S1AA65_ARCPL|nr:unnamed protein product [Arctia plantaginis]